MFVARRRVTSSGARHQGLRSVRYGAFPPSSARLRRHPLPARGRRDHPRRLGLMCRGAHPHEPGRLVPQRSRCLWRPEPGDRPLRRHRRRRRRRWGQARGPGGRGQQRVVPAHGRALRRHHAPRRGARWRPRRCGRHLARRRRHLRRCRHHRHLHSLDRRRPPCGLGGPFGARRGDEAPDGDRLPGLPWRRPPRRHRPGLRELPWGGLGEQRPVVPRWRRDPQRRAPQGTDDTTGLQIDTFVPHTAHHTPHQRLRRRGLRGVPRRPHPGPRPRRSHRPASPRWPWPVAAGPWWAAAACIATATARPTATSPTPTTRAPVRAAMPTALPLPAGAACRETA